MMYIVTVLLNYNDLYRAEYRVLQVAVERRDEVFYLTLHNMTRSHPDADIDIVSIQGMYALPRNNYFWEIAEGVVEVDNYAHCKCE